MADPTHDHHNVLAVTFTDDGGAYEALTDLKQLDTQSQIELQAAAVVTRDSTGQVTVKDEIGDLGFGGTATGGIVGLLVGIIGGPLGVLIGGATGLLVGSLFDLEDADDSESVLSEISKLVQVGHATLLAEVDEPSPEVIDTAMTRLSGHVLRRPVVYVEAEIAAAEDAQRAAKKEARKRLREQRHAERQDEIHSKVAALKAKLHVGQQAAPSKA